jgi:hypothetical protein
MSAAESVKTGGKSSGTTITCFWFLSSGCAVWFEEELTVNIRAAPTNGLCSGFGASVEVSLRHCTTYPLPDHCVDSPVLAGLDVTVKRESAMLRLKHVAVGLEEQLAKVRIMYWKEIPVQVQAQDETGQVSQPLNPRFQEAADAVAMLDGSAGSDAYLDGWGYGAFSDVNLPAGDAARDLAERFNNSMPADFVARIRDLFRAGKRDEAPGAINSWAGVAPEPDL